MAGLPTIAGEFKVHSHDMRYSDDGKAHMRLRLIGEDRRLVEGEWKTVRNLFITAKMHGKLAENINDSIEDKDLILVEGQLVTEEWVEGGQKKSAIVLDVRSAGVSNRFRVTKHGTEPADAPQANAPQGGGGFDGPPPF